RKLRGNDLRAATARRRLGARASEGECEMKKLFATGAAILVLTGCKTIEESPIPVGGTLRNTFVCEGDQAMTVDFAEGLALLKVNNVSVELAQQPSGSGVHYTGGGYELQGKGPEMTWTDPAGAAHQCRSQQSPS